MGMLIKKSDKASLSNILNEMVYKEKMTLQELRFFIVYLSKINPKEPENTQVTFSLDEYVDLLGVELNEAALDNTIDRMLRHIVHVRPREMGEDELEAIIKCQLFSSCKFWKKKSDGKYYLTFDCHEDLKDHLFEFKGRFTSLEVWNILTLKSFQDARMYMLLKQYLKIGERIIDLSELKQMLGIHKDSYPEYKIFSRDVLKKAQASLKSNTDICFDYKAVGRPAHSVRFIIRKNTNYTVPEFLKKSSTPKIKNPIGEELPGQINMFEIEDTEPDQDDNDLAFFREPFQEVNPRWNITDEQVEWVVSKVRASLPFEPGRLSEKTDLMIYDKITDILKQAKADGVRSIYGWLKKMFKDSDILE